MNPYFKLTSLALMAALAACGKPQSAAEATAEAPAVVAAAVPTEVAAAPAAPTGINGTPVDTCAMLDANAAAEGVGTLFKDPEAQTAQGSLLGGCNYIGNRGLLMLSARPAAEYGATVDFAAKKGGAKPVSDLSGKASMTSAGLMLQPDGKPFFLVVYPMLGGKFDEAAALRVAQQLKI